MGFDAIVDVISKILKEPVPGSASPILALGKTDKERLISKQKVAPSEDASDSTVVSRVSAERRRWLREAYKVPLAAAGLTHSRTSLTEPMPSRAIATAGLQTAQQVDWERARERRLRSQATRGVIALFNSVKQHQSAISSYTDRTDLLPTQKEKIFTKITTNDFLDRLSAGLPKSKQPGSADSGVHTATSLAGAEPVTKKIRHLRTTFGRKRKSTASGR